MVSPYIGVGSPQKPFFWNVDHNVGLNSPNLRADVDLVQLGFACAVRYNNFTPQQKAVFAKVVPGAPCSGREDDPLVQAIRAFQPAFGGYQDGHVSPITSTSGTYADRSGSHIFMLIGLNNLILDTAPNDYPRLEKWSNCPPALRARVLECMVR